MSGLLNLALDLARIHQPARRPDYTVDLQGQSYGLSDESDMDTTIIVWTGNVPTCPQCHEPLTQRGEEDTKSAPVRFFSAWCVPELRCAGCGARIVMRDQR